MKKNVLVFPCGSEIGLEIYRSVCYSTHYRLVGGSSVDDHGRFVYKDYIGGLPLVSDTNFISELNKVIKEHGIDLVFPAHDDVVVALAKASDSGNLACEFVGSSIDTSEVARLKSLTYKRLEGIVPTPKRFDTKDVVESDLPVFIKPDKGQGSKGAQRIDSLAALRLLDKNKKMIITEFLPGREFTVDCLSDHSGALLYAAGRERLRIANGISVRSSRIQDARLRSIAENINKALSFKGAWFFQLKERADGQLVLLEIAPRIAGTMGLSRAYGVNLPLLSLFIALDKPVSVEENNYDVIIDRALSNRYHHNITYDHVYIDFDDVILQDEVINIQVMAYVFQCFNQGKKVHLITRHAKDINTTLIERRLASLFDEVIALPKGAPKSDYIRDMPAIFIDDSFAERDEVSRTLGIPVFDLHMVEILMEV